MADPAVSPRSAIRICRARVRIASSSARFSAFPTGTARPPDWRKAATFSARASSDGSETKTVTRNGPAPFTVPQPVTSSPEKGSALLQRQEGERVERGLPEVAVDRHLAIRVAAVAEQVEEALVADLVLDVAALHRALLLQLAVTAAARERGENRGGQADCTHVLQEPRPGPLPSPRGV